MPDTDWFRNARFGLMAHWGVYSAIGRGEWVLNRERMPWDEYRAAALTFTAEHFDARAWAALARDAGQQYLILTAKHHDGYCLWDTRTTDWNSARIGPRRDLVGELVDAFHSAGLRVGFYFSLADWSHPDYPTPYATDWPERWSSDAARQRVVEYDLEQVRELTHNYGKIDVLWWDGAAPGMTAAEWEADRFVDLCRSSNPDILLNNRLFVPGDFNALELHLGAQVIDRPWETDYPLNDNWAWNPDDQNYKSPLTVWNRLVAANGNGGNLLLNVAPRGDGTIPDIEQSIVRAVGRQFRRHRHLDLGTPATELRWIQGGQVTRKGNTLYLHLPHRHGPVIAYGGVRTPVRRVTLAATGTDLPFTRDPSGRIRITVPESERDPDFGYTLAIECEGVPEGFGVGHQNLNF